MFPLLNQTIETAMAVLFPGTMLPRAEEFDFLQRRGITVRRGEPPVVDGWSLDLSHPAWGEAKLVATPGRQRPPRFLIDFAPYLTDQDREAVASCGVVLSLHHKGERGHILRDRKLALRYARAVMGEDGRGAIDQDSCRIWRPRHLDDELEHDADLDVESLYAIHLVSDDEDASHVLWAHTHGLGEVGGFDFDVVEPHDYFLGPGSDLFRTIAFRVLEGALQPHTPVFEVGWPLPPAGLVPAAQFDRRAAPQEAALREDPQGVHRQRRSVICEPRAGLLGRWRRPRRCQWLTEQPEADAVFHISTAATQVMAERAHHTVGVLRRLLDRFAAYDLPVLVKLGYTVDGGDPTDREHLWFEVHRIGEHRVEATLASEPLAIARMQAGDRGWHDLALLSDWVVVTPAGWITPRQMAAVHILDEQPKLLKQLRASKRSKHHRA